MITYFISIFKMRLVRIISSTALTDFYLFATKSVAFSSSSAASLSEEASLSDEEGSIKTDQPITKPISTSLNPRHRKIAEGGIPPLQYEFEREKWAMGERFGTYGLKSGVDIRKLWPTVEEVTDFGELGLYRTAKDSEQIAKENAEKKRLHKKNKLEKIEENWAKYDSVLAEHYEMKEQASQEQVTQEKELQRQIRMVQEHFGYYVDPEDPRFRPMVGEREEAAKLEAKMARKELKKRAAKQQNEDGGEQGQKEQ